MKKYVRFPKREVILPFYGGVYGPTSQPLLMDVSDVKVLLTNGISINEIIEKGEEKELTLDNYNIEVINVESVSITPEMSQLEIGQTVKLSSVVIPENATEKSFTYTSDDVSIATVDQDGMVTAVSEGEVLITVTTTDGEFTDSSIITVSAPVPETPEEPTGE